MWLWDEIGTGVAKVLFIWGMGFGLALLLIVATVGLTVLHAIGKWCRGDAWSR